MDKVWYYKQEDGTKYGPYSEDELIRMIKVGVLNENDMIWMVDFDNWMRLGDSIYSFYLDQEPDTE